MNPTEVVERNLEEQRKPARTAMGGSVASGLLGLGAAVLAIIALAGGIPAILTPIAGIALGVSLILEGGAVAGRFAAVLSDTVESGALGMGASIESICGIGGAVLSLLVLLGMTGALIPIAVIVLGAGLIFGSGAIAALNSAIISRTGEPWAVQRVANQMISASADIKLLLGMGAITLGILALLGFNPAILTLAAFIAMGASMFLDATSISTRMASIVRR